jgi:hypothetical protein
VSPRIDAAVGEIYENWPAFTYIGLMVGFSILFFRERRAETEALKRIGSSLQDRIERLEQILARRLEP